MRFSSRLAVAAATALAVIAAPVSAFADDHGRRGYGGYEHGYGYGRDGGRGYGSGYYGHAPVYRHGYTHGYDRGRYDDRRRYDRHDDDNDAIVAGVAGLAIGALIGSAIAADRNRPAPPPPRYAPQRYDSYQTQDRRAYDGGRICVSREEVWDGYQRRYITVETSRYC